MASMLWEIVNWVDRPGLGGRRHEVALPFRMVEFPHRSLKGGYLKRRKQEIGTKPGLGASGTGYDGGLVLPQTPSPRTGKTSKCGPQWGDSKTCGYAEAGGTSKMVFEEAEGQTEAPRTRRLATILKASKGPPWPSSHFSSSRPKVTEAFLALTRG